MYVDAVTTAAVVDELTREVLGGRVQDVIEVDAQSVGLEIYANRERRYLLMTIEPDAARCQLVPDRLRRGRPTPSPLGQLLAKYVEGARLVGVSQPPWERILHLDFSGHNGETRLIVETMGRLSNLILTVEGDILDSLKRVPSSINRYREILPGRPYVPPPPQDKIAPEHVSVKQVADFLAQRPNGEAWRALVNNIAGVSPLFAREIVYFASGDPEAPAFDVSPAMLHAAFAKRVQDVLDRDWTPCVVPAPEGDGYVAFAAYPLTLFDGWQTVGSISEAMTQYFGAPVGLDAYTAAKGPVQRQIDDALDRVRRKLDSLERQSASAERAEELRKQGELILAYGPTLPRGQGVLEAQYDPGGPVYRIELDPELPYQKNAEAYFERYDKAKRAAQELPRLKAQARHELDYLQQLATDLALAENWPEIDAVREELQEAGYWQGQRRQTPGGGRPGVRRFTTGDGFVIFVGRNARQNHALVTERSTGSDLWLHARGVPGSHVIIKNGGRTIPDEVITTAAQLAAYYSAARADTSVEVDVTERRYVRPIKGGKPGMVTYRNEQTLSVRPGRPQSA